MALTRTTLSGAVVIDQNTITVVSATGATAGGFARIDDEMMEIASGYVSGLVIPTIRGVEGTKTSDHPTAAGVVFGTGTDFSNTGPAQAVTGYLLAGKPTRIVSYSAAGAIALPNPGENQIVVINGTGALAMTLAVPTTDMDGCLITFAPNGKAAHTVTATGGFGANTTNSDVLTFHATQVTCVDAMAMNGVWQLKGFVAGAATVAGPGLA